MTTPYTLEWVRAQIALHKSKINDLEAMERVMAGAEAPASATAGGGMMIPSPVVSPSFINQYGAKKRHLFQLLEFFEGGLSTAQLVSGLIDKGFMNVTVANTSPQLSGYRADGLLDLTDGCWRLTKRGRQYLDDQKL